MHKYFNIYFTQMMDGDGLSFLLSLSQVTDIPRSIQTMKVIVDGRGSYSGQL